MSGEFNTATIIAIIAVVVILFLVYSKRKEAWRALHRLPNGGSLHQIIQGNGRRDEAVPGTQSN